MKTKQQIEYKITEHESWIYSILEEEEEWTPLKSELLSNYLNGRKALRWVLSDDNYIEEDDLDKKVNYEIACYESSKIF